MVDFGEVDTASSLIRTKALTRRHWVAGGIAPGLTRRGTDPDVDVWNFTNGTAAVSATIGIPDDMDVTVDPVLRCFIAWEFAQTNGNELGLRLNYVAMIPHSTGDGPDRASTGLDLTVTATTANGLAADDVYTATFTIDASDATNPLTSADSIGFGFKRKTISTITNFYFLGAEFEYEAVM